MEERRNGRGRNGRRGKGDRGDRRQGTEETGDKGGMEERTKKDENEQGGYRIPAPTLLI
jgi:hypothetical protein